MHRVWVSFAGCFFLYHAVSTALRSRQSRVWHITVDWPTQRIELATRSGTVEIPTTELREIELWGIVRHGHHRTGGTHRVDGGTGGTPDQYRLSVVLHLGTGDETTSVMMLETNRMQSQCPLVVYQYMLSSPIWRARSG